MLRLGRHVRKPRKRGSMRRVEGPVSPFERSVQSTVTRRSLMKGLAVGFVPTLLTARPIAQRGSTADAGAVPYSPSVLPGGIRSRFVNNGNGIRMHVLEAGFDTPNRPALVLLHGFPELAFSWRRVMVPLASAGYHVIAPDLRGYGRTSGTEVTYDDDLGPFRTLNEVRDILGLVSAFGYRSVAAVIGHDFGSPVSAWCAVVRPDVFRSVVLMSAPFGGTPSFPFNTANAAPAASAPADNIYDALAKLNPPRKHYQRYYATREANQNLSRPPEG